MVELTISNSGELMGINGGDADGLKLAIDYISATLCTHASHYTRRDWCCQALRNPYSAGDSEALDTGH